VSHRLPGDRNPVPHEAAFLSHLLNDIDQTNHSFDHIADHAIAIDEFSADIGPSGLIHSVTYKSSPENI
jgi:hypothetical protein